MEKINRQWRYQINDEQKVTLRAQGLGFRWPGGGYMWKRPTYVHVEGTAGEQSMPIWDMTRILTLGLYFMSAVILLISFFNRSDKE